MRSGLVRHNVGNDASLRDLHEDVRGVCEQANRHGASVTVSRLDPFEGFVEAVRPSLEVAGPNAELDLLELALNGDDRGTCHGCRQRLSSSHSPEPTCQYPATRQ